MKWIDSIKSFDSFLCRLSIYPTHAIKNLGLQIIIQKRNKNCVLARQVSGAVTIRERILKARVWYLYGKGSISVLSQDHLPETRPWMFGDQSVWEHFPEIF